MLTNGTMSAIIEGYEASTRNRNRFAEAVLAVDWDEQFFADEEFYFVKGDLMLTTPSLDPFEVTRAWRPAFIFADTLDTIEF